MERFGIPREPAPIKRTLLWSLLDGLLHAVMLGVSESYLGVFAVELGHQDTALALLATVPPLFGALSQFMAPWLVDKIGTRKRLVVAGATLQAASHLGLMLIAMGQVGDLFPLMLAKIAFWVSGMVIAPPWNAWMGAVTEATDRARYFLWRTTACHVAVLVSFLGAGIFLHAGRTTGVHERFVVLFLLGLGLRLLGAFALSAQTDPDPPASRSRGLSMRVRHAVAHGPWRLAFSIGLLQFGAHVAVPFFTPYMLRDLELNLDAFAWLTSVAIITKVVTLPLWGQFVRRTSMSAAMVLSVAIISAVPAIWVWSTSISDLILVQAIGGVGWAGFEYVSLQLLLAGSPKESSVEFFSLSSSITGTLQLLGSLLGSALLAQDLAYHAVFLLSSGLRALPLLLLAPVVLSMSRGLRFRQLWLRLVSVRPTTGPEHRPLPSPPEDKT